MYNQTGQPKQNPDHTFVLYEKAKESSALDEVCEIIRDLTPFDRGLSDYTRRNQFNIARENVVTFLHAKNAELEDEFEAVRETFATLDVVTHRFRASAVLKGYYQAYLESSILLQSSAIVSLDDLYEFSHTEIPEWYFSRWTASLDSKNLPDHTVLSSRKK